MITKYITTRLLGRFASIFCFKCEHVLFVYNVKQKQNKKFRGFYQIKFVDFKIFKSRILMEANFCKFDYPLTFPGVTEVPLQIWARSVQLFGRLLDTNGQTDRQTIKVYIYKLTPTFL